MEYLRSGEVAARLGVTTETLRRWRHEKKGPPAEGATPRTRRYPVEGFMEWFKAEWLGEK
jgi:DNA-binding transcriptional MerR regulator